MIAPVQRVVGNSIGRCQQCAQNPTYDHGQDHLYNMCTRQRPRSRYLCIIKVGFGWLGSRVVSVLDSGAE